MINDPAYAGEIARHRDRLVHVRRADDIVQAKREVEKRDRGIVTFWV